MSRHCYARSQILTLSVWLKPFILMSSCMYFYIGHIRDARTAPESTIEQVMATAINQTLRDKNSFLSTLKNNIENILIHENDTTLADIDNRLEELQTEILKLASSKTLGGRTIKRITAMGDFLKGQSIALTEYSEPLVRRLIEKITFFEGKFTVEF
jgi:site-specific DNA recombinase